MLLCIKYNYVHYLPPSHLFCNPNFLHNQGRIIDESWDDWPVQQWLQWEGVRRKKCSLMEPSSLIFSLLGGRTILSHVTENEDGPPGSAAVRLRPRESWEGAGSRQAGCWQAQATLRASTRGLPKALAGSQGAPPASFHTLLGTVPTTLSAFFLFLLFYKVGLLWYLQSFKYIFLVWVC